MWNGIVGGILTFAGLALLYSKFPIFLRRFVSRKWVALTIDLFVTAAVYYGLAAVSGSFAAIVAGGVVACLISLALNWERKKYWEIVDE